MTLAATPPFDLFPAFVSVFPADHETEVGELTSAPMTEGGYQLIKTRILVANGRLVVAQDSHTGPQIVLEDTYEWGSFYKNQDVKQDSYVITTTGRKIVFRKDSNCGCGSRLRSWNPYGIVNSMKDPQE